VATLDWKLTGKTWVNYLFRDTVATVIRSSDNIRQPFVTALYPKNVQQTYISDFPQNLLSLIYLIKLCSKNEFTNKLRQTSIQLEQIELGFGDLSSWNLKVMYVNQDIVADVTETEKNKILTKACSVSTLSRLKLAENFSETFKSENFPNLRQLNTEGEYANGTVSEDAFIFTADLLPDKNQSIFGMGGRDCVFMTKHKIDLEYMEITGGEHKLDISVKVDKQSYPIIMSYHKVTMLQGRENVGDTVVLSSCSLHMLDTNSGNKSNHDVILIHRHYRPCRTALKIFIGKHTNVLNYCEMGKFVYQISPAATSCLLLIKKSTDISHHSAHHIYTNVGSHEAVIKSHTIDSKLFLEMILQKNRIVKIQYHMTNSELTCSAVRLIFTDDIVTTLDRTVQVTAKTDDDLTHSIIYEKVLALLQGATIFSSRKYTAANSTIFSHFHLETSENVPEIDRDRKSLMSVFVINPNYQTEIDHRGHYFLIDITPNCVNDILHSTECGFEPVRLKRMPDEKLIVSFSDVCLALAEKHAMLDVQVFYDMHNATLEINVEIVEQQGLQRKHVGYMLIEFDQFSNYRSEEILLAFETLMSVSVKNKQGFQNIEPVPLVIDHDTELVIMLPDVTIRPAKFMLNRFIHSYKCYMQSASTFVVAFECFKGEEECVPNLTFVLFDYNAEENRFTFPQIQISSQGDNFNLKKST